MPGNFTYYLPGRFRGCFIAVMGGIQNPPHSHPSERETVKRVIIGSFIDRGEPQDYHRRPAPDPFFVIGLGPLVHQVNFGVVGYSGVTGTYNAVIKGNRPQLYRGEKIFIVCRISRDL